LSCRYLLLHHYGGTYVDLDVVCLTPLSVIFASAPIGAGVLVPPTQPLGVSNDFIAVRRPHDAVIRGVIAGLRRAAVSPWYPPLPYTTVMFRTGPVYFTRLVSCYAAEGGVFVIPASKYYGTYVRYVGGASWHSWDGWLIWKLFLLLKQLYEHSVLLVFLLSALVLFSVTVRNGHFVVGYL